MQRTTDREQGTLEWNSNTFNINKSVIPMRASAKRRINIINTFTPHNITGTAGPYSLWSANKLKK